MELDSALVQEILLEQLREANENRYYLMSVIRQQERNFQSSNRQLQAELDNALIELASLRQTHSYGDEDENPYT